METEAVSETEKISQQNITEPVDVSRGWHDESGFRWRGFERLALNNYLQLMAVGHWPRAER